MRNDEKRTIYQYERDIVATLNTQLDNIYPARTEVHRDGTVVLTHALAMTNRGLVFGVDRETEDHNPDYYEYRLSMMTLEEECRRRNVLLHMSHLVIKYATVPRIEEHLVRKPNNKLFKGHVFDEPDADFSTMRRWNYWVQNATLLPEEEANDRRTISLESDIHTLYERCALAGMRSILRRVRKAY